MTWPAPASASFKGKISFSDKSLFIKGLQVVTDGFIHVNWSFCNAL